MESSSFNALSWISNPTRGPWEFLYILKEISHLSSSHQVIFHHIIWSANDLVDALAKQGVERLILLWVLMQS